MATAADLIRRSLKLLGVLAAGESPTAEDQADVLVELNALLGTWANERLLVHGTRRSSFTLPTNNSPTLIGPSGELSTTRPLRIDAAGVVRVGQTKETPLRLLTDAEFAALADKSQTAEVPECIWVEWTHPNASLWLSPVPTTAATLVLYTWSRITEFSSVSDAVSLPDGYDNALAHALALQVAPMFGAEPSGMLLENARASRAAIECTNLKVGLLRADPAIVMGGGFNLVTGDGG